MSNELQEKSILGIAEVATTLISAHSNKKLSN